MPLRVACAGGAYPLFDEIEKTEENDNGSDDETIPKKGPPKGPKTYSEFVFTSKFKSLIVELEKIRDNDPSSKSMAQKYWTGFHVIYFAFPIPSLF